MVLDIHYIPSVVKSLYAEEDSAFYYVNPFEDSELGRSSICATDTSLDFTESPGSDSEPRSPDRTPGCAKDSTGSCRDSEFDKIKKQRVDEMCLPRKREKSFESSEASREHTSEVFEEQSPSANSSDDRRPFKKTPYACHRCGKSYRWPSYLRRHLKTHPDAENFTCEICAKPFRSMGELRNHLSDHGLHVCLHCQKSFNKIVHLKIHHTKAHAASQATDCEICEGLSKPEVNSNRKRKRPSEASLDYREEHCRTTEFDHFAHFSGNGSGNDAGIEDTVVTNHLTLQGPVVEISRTGRFLNI